MIRPHRRLRGAPAAALTLLLAPPQALAGGLVGLDFDLGAPMNQSLLQRYLSTGVGLGVRVGWRFDLGPVWLQPEAGAAFVAFNRRFAPFFQVPASSSDTYSVPRLLAGARLGLGLGCIVKPAIFGHVGLGWREHVSSGPAADVGLAFEVELVPHFILGTQLAYNVVVAAGVPDGFPHDTLPPVQWISAGLYAVFTL